MHPVSAIGRPDSSAGRCSGRLHLPADARLGLLDPDQARYTGGVAHWSALGYAWVCAHDPNHMNAPKLLLLAAAIPALAVITLAVQRPDAGALPVPAAPRAQGQDGEADDGAPEKLAALGYGGQDGEAQDAAQDAGDEAEVDAGPPPPPPDEGEHNAARELAVTALDELRLNDALLVGARSHDQGESATTGGAVNFIVKNGRVQGQGGSGFVGDLEAYVRSDGVSCIVSRNAIPGFGIWMGERKLVHSTYEDAPFELAETQQELKGLFDFERLLDRARKAEWHAAEEVTNGGWFLEAQLPGDLVPGETDQQNRFGGVPQVLHVNVALVLDTQGRLSEADFDVVRSTGMNGIRINGRAASDNEVGATSTYSFQVSYGAPSERILWFSRLSLQMLGPGE